ncbi:metallophosphoesterase [Streptomyces lateritius]|uniref:metallophosphoesterase family protein n=1 Tax=Streptomyces lateritius TaxID=67313 RepID=UPI001C8BE9E8|nr:metallophosphoesterase [Streptomyces lateritius]MBX9427071.1 metallophosphoesterase [Streptomyces lateritius]
MKVRELRGHAEELGFTPQEQVRWLAPGELARTAVKALLAAVFAGYSDKREIQEVLPADLVEAPLGKPDAREIWIDYVADLGDGFDATSSVACTLAEEELSVPLASPGNGDSPGDGDSLDPGDSLNPGDAGAGDAGPGAVRAAAVRAGDAPLRLSRGSLLVLGGDEVYPTASATGYEDRMKGPYRAALPEAADPPLMVALPGNHDWYDGLTAFLRMFTQQRPIGAWQTRQTRSYFCVRLPERWWLVGLDSQLGSYFDDPQLRYFEKHLSANLQAGDGVIVCSAEPTWLKSAGGHADAFNALHWFDRNLIRTRLDPVTGRRVRTDAAVRLWLTGDRHHYARYAERLPGDPPGTRAPAPDPRRRQMVTCGLGGAYLAATHRLPPVLSLPPRGARLRDRDEPPVDFARMETAYPDARQSRRLARGIAVPWSGRWLPWRNVGFAKLAAVLHAGLFLLMSFLFALAEGVTRPVDAVRRAGAGDVWGYCAVCLGAAGALLVLGFLGRLLRRREVAPPSGPAVAVLSQGAVALAALAVTVAVPFPVSWDGWVVLVVCLAIAAVLGASVGSGVFALWVLSARGGQVAEWQMSGQSIEDHKGFLRLHIAPGGDLTLFPLVLATICRDWDLRDDPSGGKRTVPVGKPHVRLIEEPVVISRGV